MGKWGNWCAFAVWWRNTIIFLRPWGQGTAGKRGRLKVLDPCWKLIISPILPLHLRHTSQPHAWLLFKCENGVGVGAAGRVSRFLISQQLQNHTKKDLKLTQKVHILVKWDSIFFFCSVFVWETVSSWFSANVHHRYAVYAYMFLLFSTAYAWENCNLIWFNSKMDHLV